MTEAPEDAPAAPVTNLGGGGPVSGAGSGGVGAVWRGRVGRRADGGGAPAVTGGHRGFLRGPKMAISQLVVGLNFHLDRPVIDHDRTKGALQHQAGVGG